MSAGEGVTRATRRNALVERAPRLWALLNAARLDVLRPVLFAGAICKGPRTSRAIALTFDDGPDPVTTPPILDCLERANAKVTFFFSGRAIEEHPTLARRAAERHEIGTHLYSHDRSLTRSLSTFEAEVGRCFDVHARVFGRRPESLRFPFGDPGRVKFRDARRLGLTPYHWTFSSEDSSATSADDVAFHVMPRLHAGAIVLLHDGRGPGSTKGPGSRRPTVEALPRILDAAVGRGLGFVTVGELFAGG